MSSETNEPTSPTNGKKPARKIDRVARESQTLQALQSNNTNNLRTMFESIGSQRQTRQDRGATLPRNFEKFKPLDYEDKSSYASQKEPVARTTSDQTTTTSSSANWKTSSGGPAPTSGNSSTSTNASNAQQKAAWKSTTPSASSAQQSSSSQPQKQPSTTQAKVSTAHSTPVAKSRPTGFVWSSVSKNTAPPSEDDEEDESASRSRPKKAKPKPNPERQTVRLEAQQIQQYIQQQLQMKQQQGKQPTNAQASSQPKPQHATTPSVQSSTTQNASTNSSQTSTVASKPVQNNTTTKQPTQQTTQQPTPTPNAGSASPTAQIKQTEAPKTVQTTQTQTTQTQTQTTQPKPTEEPKPTTQSIAPSSSVSQSSTRPSTSQVSQSTSGASNSDQFLVINEKWRINFEDLEFDELVSAGSAGEVYLGYFFGTPVAIKKLYAVPPDQKHLVAREFSLLTDVNHPNIVQFLGICDHTSGIYLITEYVEHGDLFDLLVFGSEDIGWKNKVRIALQIAQAVYYLHSKNIIHRDLKSQNVLIGEANKVKLCDLGLATIMESRQKRMTVCGTNEWMAPEIGIADHYDSKVDVFSFGIVLVELISNKPPSKRTIQERFAFNVKAFQALVPPTCPPEFAQLVIDCTVYDPAQRPTFKEIVPRLRNLASSLDD